MDMLKKLNVAYLFKLKEETDERKYEQKAMKLIWAQRTLENRFLQGLITSSKQTNPPPGYEDEIKAILRENIFDHDGVIAEREGSVSGSQGTVDNIDLIIQTQSHQECVEVKMYQFVKKVPQEIIDDFVKLNELPTSLKRSFLYFGFYGHYQQPATAVKFSTVGRLNEITQQCNSMNAELLKILGQQPILDECAAIVNSTFNRHIYYAYWMTF